MTSHDAPGGHSTDPLEDLRQRLARACNRPRWRAGATDVWKRHVKNPSCRSMAGVVEDPMERNLVKQTLEWGAALQRFDRDLDWDGASFARKRTGSARKTIAQWQVGAAGKGGDQGDCKSCVAFATIAAIEARLLLKDPVANAALDLSEAHLYFCGHGSDCTLGWTVAKAIKFAFANGLVLEADYPYDPTQNTCPVAPPIYGTILGCEMLNPKLEATKATIRTDGPVIAIMRVYADFLAYIDMAVPYEHLTGEDKGLHAVTIYDHDDANWLALNSWGPGWGTNGCFRIPYGHCEIDDYFFFAPKV